MLASSLIEERGLGCLWVSLDGGDADPATLFHYLSIAGRRRAGRRRVNLPPLTPEFLPGLEIFTLRFAEELFGLFDSGFAVVLDNCHAVPADAPLMQTIVGALIDSLPEHGQLLCLSRQPLPASLARLTLDPGFVALGWEELRFTDAEAVALANLSSTAPVPGISACNQRVRGWIAGLKLLLRTPEALERVGEPPMLAASANAQLFDYFAEQVLRRTARTQRDFLLRCAVLTDMDGESAALVSGRSDAERLLAALYGERLFIERRDRAAGYAYRFHPLFHDFLYAMLRRDLGGPEVAALEARAAGLLEKRGELQAATEIALRGTDAGLLARLILTQADALFEQGRLLTLQRWIEALPDEQRNGSGWLLYWFGLASALREPARARANLERAYGRFLAGAEEIGTWLAVSGIIHCCFIDWGSEPESLQHWTGVFEALLAQNQGSVPEPVEAVVITLLANMIGHCPEHPVARHLAGRARVLSMRLRDPEQRCAIGSIAVGFLVWQGDETGAWTLIDELQRGRGDNTRVTLGSLVFDIWRGTLLWVGAQYERALEVLTAVRMRCRSSGLAVYEWNCIAHLYVAALGLGDMQRAGQLLQDLFEVLAPERINNLRISQAARAQYLALSGKPGPALALAREVRDGSGTLRDAPSSAAFVQCFLSSALLEAGALEDAAACAADALQLAARLPSDRWAFDATMLQAGIALERGALEAALSALRTALGIAARRGFSGGLSLFHRQRTARLLASALRYSIEPDCARHLIRCLRLAPPEEVEIARVWPVSLRIRVLAGFSVDLDEQPLLIDTRGNRKPLEVLKALIGLGPTAVGFEALCAALWPDLEADAARNACHVAIHRLRKILGDAATIEAASGQIGWSPRNAWIDVAAFRRCAARLHDALAAGIASAAGAEQWSRQLVDAYPGHFLPDEERPWIVGVRERLRSRFVRLADALSRPLVHHAAWDALVELARHVIELDPHAEEFHRSLMRGLMAQGRKAEALDAFARCRELLRAGLDIEPSVETLRLHRQIREP